MALPQVGSSQSSAPPSRWIYDTSTVSANSRYRLNSIRHPHLPRRVVCCRPIPEKPCPPPARRYRAAGDWHRAPRALLPLIGDEKTSKVVEQALDELVAADDIPGSALLFLRGISRLRVYDHVRECAWLVSRRQHERSCRLANGATIVPICTTSACVAYSGEADH